MIILSNISVHISNTGQMKVGHQERGYHLINKHTGSRGFPGLDKRHLGLLY